jgi:hypothetical protein
MIKVHSNLILAFDGAHISTFSSVNLLFIRGQNKINICSLLKKYWEVTKQMSNLIQKRSNIEVHNEKLETKTDDVNSPAPVVAHSPRQCIFHLKYQVHEVSSTSNKSEFHSLNTSNGLSS